MNTAIKTFIIFLLALIALSCTSLDQDVKKEMTPAEATHARRVIVNWLECEECTEKELEQLKAVGTPAIPLLKSTLIYGLAPAKREAYKHHLEIAYRDLQEYAKTHPDDAIKVSREEYVDLYLNNLETHYRNRAIQGIGAIGGEEARRALEESLQANIPAPIKQNISDTLKIGTWPTPE